MPICEKVESGRLIVREENKRKIVFLNEAKLKMKIIEVDGCKITVGQRCDYLFVYQSNGDEYFVEFKGTDIKHACDQLEATIPQLTTDSRKKKYAFVIGGRVPPAINPTIQRLIAMFRRKYNAELIISNIKYCFDLARNQEIDCSRI
jgi:hypothetical protein